MTGTQRPASAHSTLKLPDDDGSARRAVVHQVKAKFSPLLVVLSGERMGSRRLVDGTVTIGRDPACDLVLTDASVSWHHARIEDRGDGFAIVDLWSTNGVSIGGVRVTDRVLVPGERVELGEVMVRFELQDAVDRKLDQLVQRMLDVDELSGLWVRRKFDAELAMALDSAGARGAPLGLLMMDLDGVKLINDTHGHLFGAYIIGEAGRVVGEAVGDRGFCCRFGGDEYIAALPGLTIDGAVSVGNELRSVIEVHHFEREGKPLRPSISVGAAAFPKSARDLTSLFQRADEALYRAKQSGKNRVST